MLIYFKDYVRNSFSLILISKKQKVKLWIWHGLPFTSPMEIRAGEYEDYRGANVIVVAAGSSQKPGESRLDLARKNTIP